MTKRKAPKDSSAEKKSFWTTLPGIVTTLTALITAVAGLVVALNSTIGLFSPKVPLLLIHRPIQPHQRQWLQKL
jgi:hypothetical protein